MLKVRRRVLLCLLLISMVLSAASFSHLYGLGYSRRSDSCVRCGAVHFQESKSLYIFGIRLPLLGVDRVDSSPLTSCWKRYSEPCKHDWVFDYQNTRTASSKSFADGFPDNRYPVASSSTAREMAKAIDALDVPGARRRALNAIGNRDNLLRFVPVEALRRFSESGSNNPAAWWQAHAKFFVIITNRSEAEAMLGRWEQEPESEFRYGFEMSREIIGKDNQ